MCDAWAKGQKVSVHGWAYGVHDGLLQDLHMSVSSVDAIEPIPGVPDVHIDPDCA